MTIAFVGPRPMVTDSPGTSRNTSAHLDPSRMMRYAFDMQGRSRGFLGEGRSPRFHRIHSARPRRIAPTYTLFGNAGPHQVGGGSNRMPVTTFAFTSQPRVPMAIDIVGSTELVTAARRILGNERIPSREGFRERRG